ncbi:MAG: molybdenum cofactor guanylyltransferase [Deltaproteobacteria bacterium]|nr:molybdenum cofactor guanylyltransferase [Deltaproteobacteria bacterium]
MSPTSLPLGALVLAGGESSRMGSPKAWLSFEGEPLLARVARRLRSDLAPIVVVAAPGQELPPLSQGVLVARDHTAHAGPLEGLAVGLELLATHASHAFVCTCDAPFASATLARALAGWCDLDAAVPEVDGRLHPLTAVYATATHRIARDLRCRGERRATAFVEALRSTRVDRATLLADDALRREDPRLLAFVNVNTPDDLEAARALSVRAP